MPLLTPSELEAMVATILDRLMPAFSPEAVYLFGSYAYGQPHSSSDMDLLLVVSESSLHPYERDAAAYRALGDLRFPVDVQVYTRSEFEERAHWPLSFERTVKEKGRLLYAA